MFPFCFEWLWDMGHYVFFGGFWYAIGILGAGLTYCVVKSIIDTVKEGEAGHEGSH